MRYAFLLLGVALVACAGGDDATVERLETLEARVAASDATATTVARHESATAEALVRYANAVATIAARPTATPPPTATAAPAPPPPAPPPAAPPPPAPASAPTFVLTGPFGEQTRQAGRHFIGLTQTTAALVANPRLDAAWQSEMRSNMLGYRALDEAWRRVAAPACGAEHYRGLAAVYATYARGAEGVLRALDAAPASSLAGLAVDVDAPPLLRGVRASAFTFEEVMRATWGASAQAIQTGRAHEFLESLGLLGVSHADLGIAGVSYRAAGGAEYALQNCN